MSAGLITIIGILGLIACVLAWLEFQERRDARSEDEWREAFNAEPHVDFIPTEETMTVYNWEDDETLERIKRDEARRKQAARKRKLKQLELSRWEKSNAKFHRDLRTGGLNGRRAQERKADEQSK